MIVLGTRPEAIKLCPLALAAERDPRFTVDVVSTGQHRDMLHPMLDLFGVVPRRSLDIMSPGQSLTDVTTAALDGVGRAVAELDPDWVVVQGDTTTTFASALAAFYRQKPVAHVEAGLRTHLRYDPFPEEANRVLTTALSTLHLAPTSGARDNLLREGVRPQDVLITGNTGIDALMLTRDKLAALGRLAGDGARRILVTAHRRENHGAAMERICEAILRIVARHPDVLIEFPVHKSPHVRATVLTRLADHDRIQLTDPLGYEDFIAAMDRATLILTDSGGVQEEAPSLGKPVLVLRESTERPEAAEAGAALIVGTDPDRVVAEVDRLLGDDLAYAQMARVHNPFGDGYASSRVLDAIHDRVVSGPAHASTDPRTTISVA